MPNNNENGLAPDGLASDYYLNNTGIMHSVPSIKDSDGSSNVINNMGVNHLFDRDIPELNKSVYGNGIYSTEDIPMNIMNNILLNMAIDIGEESGTSEIYYIR